ncbi:hypothetical protein JTB14_026211 [Gonioctena quinquepunctata]|nr:hypothetical protein JTB14_026211 [Gonioctena quinquepunctata]
MEEQLEVAVLAGANHQEIEQLLLHNIIGIAVENGENNNVEFSLNNMTDDEVKNNFRFQREDVLRLRDALRIPHHNITHSRNNVDGTTALCMLLRRLCYPNRLVDLEKLFNYSSQSLSHIIINTANFIVANHGHLLENLNAHQWLNRNRYRLYAQSISNMGGAIQNCWGFIDGTVRPICRPSINQEEYYSGHKRAEDMMQEFFGRQTCTTNWNKMLCLIMMEIMCYMEIKHMELDSCCYHHIPVNQQIYCPIKLCSTIL